MNASIFNIYQEKTDVLKHLQGEAAVGFKGQGRQGKGQGFGKGNGAGQDANIHKIKLPLHCLQIIYNYIIEAKIVLIHSDSKFNTTID